MKKLTTQQLQQIKDRGFSVSDIEQQFMRLKGNEDNPLILDRIADVTDGIINLSEKEQQHYLSIWKESEASYSKMVFVPASGMATRMFEDLIHFYNNFNPDKETFSEYVNRTNKKSVKVFFDKLSKFPFHEKLLNTVREGVENFDSYEEKFQKVMLVKILLKSKQMGYQTLPKALIPFHRYGDLLATPVFEHIGEGQRYCTTDGKANFHFTIPENILNTFEKHIASLKAMKNSDSEVDFDVSFSFQDADTDTISLTENGEILIDENGDLIFRKAGHGSLLKNLNALTKDMIFIKNIDNVTHIRNRDLLIRWKKILAAKFIEIQKHTHKVLNDLEDSSNSLEVISIMRTLEKKLGIVIPKKIEKLPKTDQIEYLKAYLNRPIRVCGMIRNDGDTGGGPFWVKCEKDNDASLQIIETTQVNTIDNSQMKILESADHSNPVDIVFGTKNYRGNKFDFSKYIDNTQCIITKKSYEGKPIKVLERPGLWNGSMAYWLTTFVEVPSATFNPAKRINDLLREDHQSK